jgi:hypothetical protein
MLPTDEDIDTMVSVRGRGSLLLDFYSHADVLERLEAFGVSSRISSRGYTGIEVNLQTADAKRQAVRVTAEKDSARHLLGEVILCADSFRTQEPFAGPLRDRDVRMLFVQWLKLQDPTAEFSVRHPRLPGQDHPGLGVGREVMTILLALAERRGFDGIMVCPEFASNAVIYSREFKFFDPAAQARFEVLVESTRELGLAKFAWAVHHGCVLDEREQGVFRWFHEEMVRATAGVVIEYLDSDEYGRCVEQARSRYGFRIDREKLAGLDQPA